MSLLPYEPPSHIHNAVIDDNTIVVLSKADTGFAKISIFSNDGNGWSTQAEWNSGILNSSPIGLALQSDRLVVSYPSDNTVGENIGRLRVYQRIGSDWSETQNIFDPMRRSENQLGEELRKGNWLFATASYGPQLFQWNGSFYEIIRSYNYPDKEIDSNAHPF